MPARGAYSQVSRQGVQVPGHGGEPELGAVDRQQDAIPLAVAGAGAGGRRRARLRGARGDAERGAQPERAEPGRAGHRGCRGGGTCGGLAAAALRGPWAPSEGTGPGAVRGGGGGGGSGRASERGRHCGALSAIRFHGLDLAREGDTAEEESRKLFDAAAPSLPSCLQAGNSFIQGRREKEDTPALVCTGPRPGLRGSRLFALGTVPGLGGDHPLTPPNAA